MFIKQLNALRFFAAIGIVLFHMGWWVYPFTIPLIQSYVQLAVTGVTFFFVLSGFIMVHVYGSRLSERFHWREAGRFYRARLSRIAPLYFVALALCVAYVMFDQQEWYIKSLIAQIFFVQSWIPHEALRLNFTAWSLSAEMFFYALFPFFFYFFKKCTWSQRWCVAGSSWLISNLITIVWFVVYAPTDQQAIVLLKFFPLLHLNSFMIGMIAGFWFTEKKKSMSGYWCIAALVLLCIDPFFIASRFTVAQHNGLLAPLFAVIIVWVAQSKGVVTRVLSWKGFILGGDISYAIYILQAPVYWWLSEFNQVTGIREDWGEGARFMLYVCVLLCICTGMHVLFEKKGKRHIRSTQNGV